MESQLHHTHGRHYDEAEILTTGAQHAGHDHNEDEHHGEKKSVIKKVKEKAKKIKNTITKHGHGHGGHEHQHHEDEDDDDNDEETVEDPEIHGAPMYDSTRVGQSGLGANLAQPRANLERPSVMAEDRYAAPVPHVSTGAYGTNLTEPSGVGEEINSGKWRSKIGQSTGMEEEPFAPNPTRMASPISVTDHTYGTDSVVNRGEGQDVNRGGLRGIVGKERMVPDPHAPKDPTSLGSDPSNYGSKVANPTHTGGKEADLSQLQHSFDKMGIDSEPKTLDHNHPENLPRDTLTGNQSSHSSSYANKVSSSASAIAHKAAAAKDVIASKLGYSGPHPTNKSHESINHPGSATDYAHMITDKVTETLAPVYEKVVHAGSSVISRVHGISGTGHPPHVLETSTVSGTPHPHVLDTSTASRTRGPRVLETSTVTDKGVSVKEQLVETLRPSEEDKALSEVITQALHRGKPEESEKKSGEDRPMGTVTESEEVRRRLGTDRREEHQDSSNVVADKGVTERLSDAVGSWFGGKGDAPQGTLGTSFVTDEGLSSKPTGDGNKGIGREP